MSAPVLLSATRLGVLGGTFDPVHYGHLALAEEARQRFVLDAVLFIPAGEPPHKPQGQADAEQRYRMALLATADHPHFIVSRLELDRSGPSYTVDTLRQLHAAYPAAAFTLILGADMGVDFPHWRDPAGILALARVVIGSRPGVPDDALHDVLASPHMAGVEFMPTPGLAISSTDLRERARTGASLRYLTPDTVVAYLVKEGIYG